MPEKYYRNMITVEWLSNEPWGGEAEDLKTVSYEITDGGSIGDTTRTVINEELTREEAVIVDVRMGGDGSFLTGLLVDEDDEDGS